MLRAGLLAAFVSLPAMAWGAVAFDTTACSGGTAANCPHQSVVNTIQTTLVTPSFSSSASATLAVACTTWVRGGGTNQPTIAWTGGTPSGASAFTLAIRDPGAANGDAMQAACYTATLSSALSSVTVTATDTDSNAQTGVLHVYILTGASTTLGDAQGKKVGGSFDDVNATLTATGAGSMLLGAFCDQFSTGGLTAAANSTLDTNTTGNGGELGAIHLTSTTSGAGSVTFGATNHQAFIATAAVEVLPITATNVTLPTAGATSVATAPTVSTNGAKTVSVVGATATAAGVGPTVSVVGGPGVVIDSTACTGGLASGCPQATLSASTASSLTTNTFSTTSAATLVVACAHFMRFNGMNVPTIAWSGGTPTHATDFVLASRDPGATNGDPSQAVCYSSTISGGALSNVAVTATEGTSTTRNAVLLAYVFQGADIGAQTGGKRLLGTFANVDATVTPAATGSVLVGAFGDAFGTSGLTPLANTTADLALNGGGGEIAIMRLTLATTTTTATLFGSSRNQAYIATAAVEVTVHASPASVTLPGAVATGAATRPTAFVGTFAILTSAGTTAAATAISVPHTTTVPSAATSAQNASIAVASGAGGAGNQTPGIWVNVTPSNMDLLLNGVGGNYGNGNFVEAPVVVDPARPSNLYTGATFQGIWKSTDFGQTWQGPINTGTGGSMVNEGAPWCLDIATNPANPTGPPILYTAAGKTTRGALVSTDGGVSWNAYPVNNVTAATDSNNSAFGNDPYSITVDPGDALHLLTGMHGFRGLSESTDGGKTWRTVQPLPANFGTSVYPYFVRTGNPATQRTTWLTVAQWNGNTEGVWRTTDSGQTWTQVATFEHFHGNSQLTWTATNVGYIGATFGVYKTTDGGLTWTKVSTANENGCVATATNLYCENGWAAGGNSNPAFETAAIASDTSWTLFPWPGTVTPQAMNDGWHKAAVTKSGSNYIIVSGNYNAGIWRYVEAGDGSAVVGLGSASSSAVATAVTVAASGPQTVTLASAGTTAVSTPILVSVPAASGSNLAVVGNQIVDANGNSVIFRGVNTEGIANVFANNDFAHGGHGPIGAYIAKMVSTDATGNAWKPRIVRLNFEHFPCTDNTRLYQVGDPRIAFSSPDIHVLPVSDWLPNTAYTVNAQSKLNGEKYVAVQRTWRGDKGRAWNAQDFPYYAVGQVYSGGFSTAEGSASQNRVYRVIASNPALLQASATQPARGGTVTFTVPSGSTAIFSTGGYIVVSTTQEYGTYLVTSKTATTITATLSSDTNDFALSGGTTIPAGAIAIPGCPAANNQCGFPDWGNGPHGTGTVTDSLGATWQYIGEWGTSGATQPFSATKVFDGNLAGGVTYFSGWIDNLAMWQDNGVFSNTTPQQGLANFLAWETNVLDPTVQACIDNGLYCEITNFDFGSAADPALMQRLQDFWGVISTSKWANNPRVLFDLWNEATDTNGYAGFAPESWAVQKPYIQTIVNLIRGNGANNIVSVPTPGFNTYADTATNDPLTGTNLVYSWHGYTGFFYGNNDAHLAAALTHGKPILVEEWGPNDNNSTTDSANFASTLKSMIEPSSGAVNPAVGSIGWAFTDQWFPDMFSDSGLSQPTQFGLVQRQWLSDLQNDHQAPGAVGLSTAFGLPGAVSNASAVSPAVTVPITNPSSTVPVGRRWGFCE